jgi:hypothetical protein
VLIATSTSPGGQRLHLPAEGALEVVVVAPAGERRPVQQVVRREAGALPLVARDQLLHQVHRVARRAAVAAGVQPVPRAEGRPPSASRPEDARRLLAQRLLHPGRLVERVADQGERVDGRRRLGRPPSARSCQGRGRIGTLYRAAGSPGSAIQRQRLDGAAVALGGGRAEERVVGSPPPSPRPRPGRAATCGRWAAAPPRARRAPLRRAAHALGGGEGDHVVAGAVGHRGAGAGEPEDGAGASRSRLRASSGASVATTIMIEPSASPRSSSSRR